MAYISISMEGIIMMMIMMIFNYATITMQDLFIYLFRHERPGGEEEDQKN